MSGSLWNKNSWHWEERNHMSQAVSLLTQCLSGSVQVDSHTSPLNFAQLEVQGYANSSVRKGKLIVAFEFTATANVLQDGLVIGTIKIDEFSQDDLTPRVSMSSVTVFVHECLASFAGKFRKMLEDETALAADQTRRAEELRLAEEAEQTKGEQKRQLLAETKSREEISIPVSEDVKASVWNANAYHWETKNAWKFVKEFLDRKFIALDNPITKITGEAEVSVRKGKKIVVFDLHIESEMATLADVNQDDVDDFKLVHTADDRKLDKSKYATIFRELAEAMRTL